MSFLSYYYTRIKELFLGSCHIVKFSRTRLGVKNINASLLLNQYMRVNEEVTLIPSQLFLGPDFLKNKYTLLGRCITESPHIGFVSALMKNEPIEDTEYIRRFLNGTLDWRSPTIMPKDRMCFRKKFERSLSEIKSGEYPPAVVYLQGGRYYIYDGKHRAALCALLGRPVRCMVVENGIVHTNVWNYMFQLIDGKEEYQLHNDFHKAFLKENECKD